jgi:hypothetical protein
MIHFLASTITLNYLSKQVGTQPGQIVAKGIGRAFDGEKETDEIHKDMMDEYESVMSRWNKANFLVSLPAGPVLKPLLEKIKENYLYKPAMSRQITREQLLNRLAIIGKSYRGIISLAFGLFFFFVLKLLLYIKGNKT